jgi:fructosamine-3-kinase
MFYKVLKWNAKNTTLSEQFSKSEIVKRDKIDTTNTHTCMSFNQGRYQVLIPT